MQIMALSRDIGRRDEAAGGFAFDESGARK
jgi:hypothetical protein